MLTLACLFFSIGRAATTYAFDVLERSGGVFLANKRVFAYALSSIPTGIACDLLGNVYIGGSMLTGLLCCFWSLFRI